ncbi:MULTISPECIES: LysR family transcriptional regulator [unclassified Neptuniibacter]|uniref:LysR family transcriptional regulator n=1 Tax=unclassified Neptuniibacter TaxID=2630693 RepID=UPI0025F830A1|nr:MULTISPECIES: LysR family transcriptional regulator [unclassified Neptuniibacter]|tara:strand:- start:1782 stop:2708 length:927 start_codon:yes stop_codon:yes gene_type:complete
MINNSYQFGFEIRHLRNFLVIAEELSFRKAAERLHIAQPALSRQMSQMEDALKCQLFDRQKRQIKLTDAGKYLQDKGPHLLDGFSDLALQTRSVAEGRSVFLRVGFSSAAMSSFLPGIIRHLQSKLHGCEFEFVEDTSDKLITRVTNKQLDAAFILHCPNSPELKVLPIQPDNIGVILPDDHFLVGNREIDLADLKNDTLILFPRSTNPIMYDDILGHCHNAGFSPKGIIETAPRSTAIGLVAARQGVATIAESLKQSCIAGTVYRPLKGKGPKVNYSAVTHKDVSGQWIELLETYIADALSVNKNSS